MVFFFFLTKSERQSLDNTETEIHDLKWKEGWGPVQKAEMDNFTS